MFIKLTRTDGRPIWINPEFIVTVEGRKDGGSIVVPGCDGLDYDVKESPQAVMDMCGGKVVVAEIPPSPAPPADPPPQEKAAEEKGKVSEVPAKKRGRKASKAAAASEPAPVPETPPAPELSSVQEPPPAPEPPAGQAASAPAEENPPAKPRKRTSRKKPAIDLTDEQMARLRKMAPGSRQKLLNTLVHLKVPNAEATAVALIANKVLEILPDNHVNWLAK